MSAEYPNPIARRLQRLERLWQECAEDAAARCIVWRAEADEWTLLRGFFDYENTAGAAAELFWPLEMPFASAAQYAATSMQGIGAEYSGLRPQLDELGVPSDWTAPTALTQDHAGLLRLCADLARHYRHHFPGIVFVLLPAAIADGAQWRDWWLQLARMPAADGVRFLTLDSCAAPVLLAAGQPPQRLQNAVPGMRIDTLALDLPEAMREITRACPERGASYDFRRAFLALTQAAGQNESDAVEQAAGAALVIAERERWPQMQYAVRYALGAFWQQQGAAQRAETEFSAATVLAGAAAPQAAAQARLAIFARMAGAGVNFGSGNYPAAAAQYAQTAAGAAQAQEWLLAIQCWRMAAQCQDLAGAHAASWQAAQQGLELGAQLSVAERPHAGLAELAQLMLAQTRRFERADLAAEVHARMRSLLVPGWAAADERTPRA